MEPRTRPNVSDEVASCAGQALRSWSSTFLYLCLQILHYCSLYFQMVYGVNKMPERLIRLCKLSWREVFTRRKTEFSIHESRTPVLNWLNWFVTRRVQWTGKQNFPSGLTQDQLPLQATQKALTVSHCSVLLSLFSSSSSHIFPPCNSIPSFHSSIANNSSAGLITLTHYRWK